jgi:hypothetical protein
LPKHYRDVLELHNNYPKMRWELLLRESESFGSAQRDVEGIGAMDETQRGLWP